MRSTFSMSRTLRTTSSLAPASRTGPTPSVLVGLTVLLLMAPSVFAASAVELGQGISLSDEDLGLYGVAVDADGETAIVFGAQSYLRALDAADPSQQVELIWPGSNQLLDADFHPQGQTAFIVGEGGLVLRYAKQDQSIEKAAAEASLMFADLTAVAWNTGGSWAYVGSSSGEIWRLRADADGGAEVHSLAGLGESPIMAIDCHPAIMMCVVAAAIEGIGVIDRDHTFTWVGGTGYPWTGIECPTAETRYCVAVADDRIVAMIELDPNDLSKAIPVINQFPDIDAYFVGIEAQAGDRTIIVTTPAGLIEHDISRNASYPWLEQGDVNDLNVSGDRIVGTWGVGEDSGWLVTSRGWIVPYAPPAEGDRGILDLWIILGIPAATGLVLLTIVYSISPRFRNWSTERFGNEEAKRELAQEKRRKRRR